MNNIVSERTRLGMHQEELARKLGVSKSTVSRWERGKQQPCGSDLIAMKELFKCTTDYLLGLTDERKA